MLTLIRESGVEGAFEPEVVRIMVAAFERAWACVQASGAELYPERAREIIGQYIIRAAMAGSRNEKELCDGALLELAQSQVPVGTSSRTGKPEGPTRRPIAGS